MLNNGSTWCNAWLLINAVQTILLHQRLFIHGVLQKLTLQKILILRAPSPKSPNNRSESTEQTPTSKIGENLVNLFSINIVNWMGSDFRKKIICSLLGLGEIRKRKPVINQERGNGFVSTKVW
ncbi:unnamed protein product [Prunus armeniaca]|uniref:Uncharacterized protein n=1 Tax=Prunus armeniaca TaxID=36596 RepID=A0A6J5XZK4_PRUAR|nr:unnamed protein product [Prunus armeniaca]